MGVQLAFSQRIDPYLDMLHKSKFDPKKNETLKRDSAQFKKAKKIYDNRKYFNSVFKNLGIKSAENDPIVHVIMEYNGSLNKLKHLNVVGSQRGSFITAEFPLSKLDEIKKLDGVVEIELSKGVYPELDLSRGVVFANLAHNSFAYRGNGIIVGIIDTGIDYNNDAFKTADLSSSRIQYIWDQTSDGASPPGYTYGTEYNNIMINSGLVAQKDDHGHGTHVTGIIAGNGQSGQGQTNFIGIAPEADIIMVKFLDEKEYDYFPIDNPFSYRVLDGIAYIREKAMEANKPYVVNLSLGLRSGQRNGNSVFERAVAEEINNQNFRNDGRIIVKAAGNAGYDPTHPDAREENKIHAGGNTPGNVQFDVTHIQYNNNQIGVELYLPKGSGYSIQITSPNNYSMGPVAKYYWDGGPTPDGWIMVSHSASDIKNEAICTIILGDSEVTGEEATLAAGTWTISMIGGTGEWDAYVHNLNPQNKVHFTDASFTNDNLISEPGNAISVITVGSVNSKNYWVSVGGITNEPNYQIGDVSWFSSLGPTRSGIQKPEIYAPGAWVASVRSHDMQNPQQSRYAWTADYYHRQGTSYSAPHVTGAVALLLEKWNKENDKNYTTTQIKQILRNSTGADNVLNVYSALLYNDIIVGLEDHVSIDNYYCPSANPTVIEPGINSQFCARFIDDEPYGDYAISYSWKIVATNSSEGEVVLGSYNSGQSNYSSWNLNLIPSLLEDENWIRDIDDNVQATVEVICYDDDGYSHKDNIEIGIKYVPNTPIIGSYTVLGSSITFSYLAGGANTYKIHYSTTSSGSPYNGTGATQGSSPVNAGTLTNYTLSGLDFISNTYYFAITALNNEGESPYSDEIVIGDVDVYDIIWTDLDGVKANGNSLTKSRVRNNWYEGAASFNELPANTDGWIEMTAVENNTYRMFGLSDYNQAATWNTIDHSFYVRSNGTIQIYESGSLKCNCGNYSSGDKVKVERQGSQILYKLNGNTIYTSNCDPNKSLIADVSLYSTTSTISNATASFPALNTSPHNIEWTDLVKVYVNDNSLTRDNSYRGWNAGAASINRLPTWTDGWIESTVQETNTYRMFGLSSSNSDPYWNTIDYNLYIRQDSKIMIYESGSYKGTFGYYSSGDKIRLEREDNQILYKLNGVTLYSSTCDPSENLYSDVSMYSPGSTLFDVKSSFRNYDQYVGQQQLLIAKITQETVLIDEVAINTDSLLIQKSTINSTTLTIPKTVYNEAILKDSTYYNPLSEIIISPNPTAGKINLNYVSEVSNNIQIEVLDYLNIMCIQKSWKIKEGDNHILLNLNPYKSRLFIVRVNDKNHIYNFKVLKE